MQRLRSGDIPQADTLKLVRRVVEEVCRGNKTVGEIVKETGFSDRHVQYRLQTARILRLVNAENSLLGLGEKLLQTEEGSVAEAGAWRRIILACPTIKILVPDIFGKNDINRTELTARIQSAADLSPATAERRTTVFCSWRRQLLSKNANT